MSDTEFNEPSKSHSGWRVEFRVHVVGHNPARGKEGRNEEGYGRQKEGRSKHMDGWNAQ